MAENSTSDIPYRADIRSHIANVTEALLKEHPLEKLTVGMILDASKISRSSFYRYFKDKYDVILQIYMSVIGNIYSESTSCEELVRKTYRYMYKKRDFMVRAIAYEEQNSLSDFMYECSFNDICKAAKAYYQTQDLPSHIIRSIKFFCAGCKDTWTDWIKGGMQEAPDLVVDSIVRNMPTPLKEFFF